jgi:multisubunit Na+/H+ antiporter MnhB subunit
MHPPGVAVTRLLYGTSVGLLMGVGFALQAGRQPGEQPPFLLGFLGLAALMFLMAWSVTRGVGPLAERFSYESEDEMAQRVSDEINEVQRSESVNAKWARLEADVLAHDLGEEA